MPEHYSTLVIKSSVSDPGPDPGGSGFKLPVWIRIRNPDPILAIEIELFLNCGRLYRYGT